MIDNVIFLIVMVMVPLLCFLGSKREQAESKDNTESNNRNRKSNSRDIV